MPEEEQEAFKRSLERMYKGKANYSKFIVAEPESPQWYITQFFEKILEERYGLPRLAMIIVDSFTWQLFYALTCTTTFEKPKKKTALYLVRKELFGLIYHTLIKGEPLSDGSVFKIPGASIITFLTDSYDKIFKDIEYLFKNEKIFYEEINNYCRDNYKKYPKLSKNDGKIDYKKNINNWRNKGVYNTNWFVLIPVLDFLLDQNKKDLTHRLIRLYLLKNAQKAIKEVLDISEQEQEKIIIDIATMIRENKKPEEFYNDNDFVFPENFNLIFICLTYQHHLNLEKSNEVIKVIEDRYFHSQKFFSPWLKARAMFFEKGATLKENKEERDKITEGYKKAYDGGVAYAGRYLAQFLLEAILINRFCNPRRVKDIDDYYGYGNALELLGPEKGKLLDIIKESSDPGKEFVEIHYSNFSPMGQIISQHYPDLHSTLEFYNEARLINNKGLEFKKTGNFELAIQCFSNAIMLNPVYTNAYSSRGYVYKKMSEYNIEYIENALDDYNMALLLDPRHESTLFNRGLLFLEKDQYENAITDFSNLININPEDLTAYSSRGQCYYRTKNFNLSIKDCNKAIEINPMYTKAYYLRSVIHKLMGNDDKAQEDLRKAKEIDQYFFLKDNMAFFL
jgi:Tfp pilus assembly protein PilF